LVDAGISMVRNSRAAFARLCEETASSIEHRKHAQVQEETARAEQERRAREDRDPLPPSKWISNAYFAGSLAESLYPKLKDVFCRFFEEQYHEIIMGGATRYGKTTLALAINGYVLYLLSCMGSPQRNFHLMEQSVLLMLNMNVTELKARSAYFAKISAWVRSTPYFAQEFTPKSNVITQLQFPKHIQSRFAGATVNAPESEDLVFFLGDEANLYDVIEDSKRAQTGKRYDAAELIEAAVHRRMNGTFMRADGTFPDPCKVVWLCKETYPNSFIRRRVNEVKRLRLETPGKVLVLESTEWGMKPEGTYEKKYFYIRTASRMKSACVLKPEDVVEAQKDSERRMQDPQLPEDEKFRVFEVPLVHKLAAEKNLEQFIRDMCGWPTEAITLFLRDRQWLKDAIRVPCAEYPSALCEHPFAEHETVLTTPELFLPIHCRQVEIRDEETGEVSLVWRPIFNPSIPRFIHVDAGLTTDPMGFVMGHQNGWTRVDRFDEEQDKVSTTLAPRIFIDAALRILPEPAGQVNFGVVLALIRRIARHGYLIGKVTMDSFQHVALSQPLAEAGFDVEIVSVDKTMDAYDFVDKAFREKRLSIYPSKPFIEEVTQLERVVTGRVHQGRPVVKVDHRPGEKKDVSDGIAGVTWQVELAATTRVPFQPQAIAQQRADARREQIQAELTAQDAFERGDYETMAEMGLGTRYV
jgi:hypothetical protein